MVLLATPDTLSPSKVCRNAQTRYVNPLFCLEPCQHTLRLRSVITLPESHFRKGYHGKAAHHQCRPEPRYGKDAAGSMFVYPQHVSDPSAHRHVSRRSAIDGIGVMLEAPPSRLLRNAIFSLRHDMMRSMPKTMAGPCPENPWSDRLSGACQLILDGRARPQWHESKLNWDCTTGSSGVNPQGIDREPVHTLVRPIGR